MIDATKIREELRKIDASSLAIEALLREETPAPPPTELISIGSLAFVHRDNWDDAIGDVLNTKAHEGKVLRAWALRMEIIRGRRNGLQNWGYITRAPYRWGKDGGNVADVLMDLATSANPTGGWYAQVRIDRFRGETLREKDHPGTQLIVADYTDGTLRIEKDGALILRLPGIPPVTLSDRISVQLGESKANEGKGAHATNEGSSLISATFEAWV